MSLPRRSPMPRRKTPMKRTGIKRKRRSTAQFTRIYGTKARGDWMRAMPCTTCKRKGRIELAHTETGGMGYKAGAETLVPLCTQCHHDQHTWGIETFCETWGITVQDLRDRARQLDQAWEAQA